MSDHATDRGHVYASRIAYHRAKALVSLRELARMAIDTGQDPSPYRSAEAAMLTEPLQTVPGRPFDGSTVAAVREQMKRLGFTQLAMAKRLGMNQGALNRILTGRTRLTVLNLERMMEALGLRATMVVEAVPREDRMVPPKRGQGVQ